MNGSERPAVLIVDDNLEWRDLLAKELSEGGYEVVPVKAYKEAVLALLDQDPPFHVAVVDMRLDDNDASDEQGLKLVEKLNDMRESTSVIMVTGYPNLRTATKALRDLSVYAYVEKAPESGEDFDRAQFLALVHQAAEKTEKKRPRAFVRRGNRILVLEENRDLRERLMDVLKGDEYEVDTISSEQDLDRRLRSQTYNLFVLNSRQLTPYQTHGRVLLDRIREYEPNPKIVVITDEKAEVVDLAREGSVWGVVSIRSEQLSTQEFREAIRRSFAYEATKYVCVKFDEVEDPTSLRLENRYILSMHIQETPDEEGESVPVWLPLGKAQGSSVVLKASIFALGIDIRPGKEIFWEIPAGGSPPQLKIQVIPKVIGNRRIDINIEQGQTLLGRLKMSFEVSEGS